jgi:myo-inositol 2-dehydrogenase/D-chiro-inositol 1-dehydrogenase
MLVAAEASKVIAMTGFHMRFHRLIKEARERIRQGVLGPLESARIVWHSPRSDARIPAWKTQRKSGGGALVELAVHQFDLLRFLLDTEFEQVHSITRNGVRDDETSVVIARLANQALVAAEFSERSPHEIEIVLSGRKGMLRIDGQSYDGLGFRTLNETNGAPAVRLRSAANFFSSIPLGVTTLRRGGDYRISYENEWRHFAHCVRSGQPPQSTLEDGLRAVEVVQAALHSASASQPVNISHAEQVVKA